MRRLAEEEEDLSEREAAMEEAQAQAAHAAAATTAGAAAGEGNALLVRVPLRAGAAAATVPTYGARDVAAVVSPAALPFLKWPAAADKTGGSGEGKGIGLSPLSGGGPHPGFVARGGYGVGGDDSPPPPRLPSPGPGADARLV